MHLEDQLAAGRHEPREPLGQRLGTQPRGVGAQKVVAVAQSAGDVSVGREHEEQDVVHHGRVAGPGLDGRDPFVLGPAGIDHEHLVIHHAGGRHVERLVAHVEHLVRLGNHPTFGELGRLGQVGRISLGRTVGHPATDELHVAVAQRGVVFKVAILLVGVPGRHAPLAHNFFDHRGPAGHVVVAGEGERRDLPFAMAEHAVGVHDPRDLVRVGHVAVGHGFQISADQTASRGGLGRRHGLLVEQRLEGVGQVGLLGRGFLIADRGLEAVLIVNPPAVANAVVLVEHDHLGRPRGTGGVGHCLVQVLEDRKFDLVHAGEGGDFGHRVLAIGVDAQEHHAARLVLGRQLDQPRRIELGQRALGAQEGQHHDLVLGHFVERVGLAVEVAEREVFDRLADGDRRGGKGWLGTEGG